MSCSPIELNKKDEDFRVKCGDFDKNLTFDGFVEFAVAVSSITEFLAAKGLSGSHQRVHAVERKVLSLFDGWGQQALTPTAQFELGLG